MAESHQHKSQMKQGAFQARPTGASLVLVTHPEEGAEGFASLLVEAHLASCVNLVETKSVYLWAGKRERSSEVLLLIKTAEARLEALEREVRSRHPYELPEFVVLNPMTVEANYLAWLLAASSGA